jgi:hypothetical protein
LATNCGIIKKYLHPNRTFISKLKIFFKMMRKYFRKTS